MASSDALPGAPAASAEAQGSDAWAGCLLGLALVLPWWLPLLGNASATFFKEALTLVLVGFAGVAAAWPDRRDPNARVHPLALATLVLALVLVVHALVFDHAWRKALLAASGLATFWISLRTSAHLRERDGKRAFDGLAACVATAALGSCVFAGLQLFGLDAAVPGVLPRAGDRLSGNVDQANQFADLLWLGAIAVVWLAATEVLPWTLAAATAHRAGVLRGHQRIANGLGLRGLRPRARQRGLADTRRRQRPQAARHRTRRHRPVAGRGLGAGRHNAHAGAASNHGGRAAHRHRQCGRIHEPAPVVLALGARHRGRASRARRRHRPAGRFGARARGRRVGCPDARRRRARAQPLRPGRCGDGIPGGARSARRPRDLGDPRLAASAAERFEHRAGSRWPVSC